MVPRPLVLNALAPHCSGWPEEILPFRKTASNGRRQAARMSRWQAVAAAVLTALAAQATLAAADETPASWQAGVVLGVARMPDYPGAARSQTRGLLLPMLIYRGPVLRVDEQGVRGQLRDTGLWSFELSATAALDARGSPDRSGMPDLGYQLGVGPQWIYKGLLGRGDGPTLHLKARGHLSSDGHTVHGQGLSLQPELRWVRPWGGDPSLRLTASLQSTWATRPQGRQFYGVDDSQARIDRPAFQARAGYHGTDATLSLTHRLAPGLSWFATVQLNDLHGAANRDSPLLRRTTQLTTGAGLVWTPWRSSGAGPD